MKSEPSVQEACREAGAYITTVLKSPQNQHLMISGVTTVFTF